jgi:hypothetical protein
MSSKGRFSRRLFVIPSVVKMGWMHISKVRDVPLSSSDDPLFEPKKYFFGLWDDGLLKGFECDQTMSEEPPRVEFNLDLARRGN